MIGTAEQRRRTAIIALCTLCLNHLRVTRSVIGGLSAPYPAPSPGSLGERLARHSGQVSAVAGRYGLSNVRVFGSVSRSEDKADSDIDLLVDVRPGVGMLSLARCQRDLEALLGAPVDLVPAEDLKAGVAASVLLEAQPLWRHHRQRLDDVMAAIDAIRSHLEVGDFGEGDTEVAHESVVEHESDAIAGTIGETPAGIGLRFEVADTGIGISAIPLATTSAPGRR